MSKGSGTTRSGGSGNPRGLGGVPVGSIVSATTRAFSAPVLGGGEEADKDIKLIRSTGFVDNGGGLWELNTPHADVSIVLDEDGMGNKIYEIQTVGAEDARTGVYTSDSPGRSFSTLNAAKAAAREELEKYYRKVNS